MFLAAPNKSNIPLCDPCIQPFEETEHLEVPQQLQIRIAQLNGKS
jgi:hypothetical protein